MKILARYNAGSSRLQEDLSTAYSSEEHLIFVLRHGSVKGRNTRRFTGSRSDPDLDEEGISQARLWQEELSNSLFDRVYSSSLKRCIDTAMIVAKGRKITENQSADADHLVIHHVADSETDRGTGNATGYSTGNSVDRLITGHSTDHITGQVAGKAEKRIIEIDCRLNEIDMGTWDGVPFEEIKRDLPLEFEKRGKEIWSYRTPGGESFHDLHCRVMPLFEEIERSGAKRVLVVTHAGVIRILNAAALGGVYGEGLFDTRVDYAQLTLISCRPISNR